jgi:hypothetical protein
MTHPSPASATRRELRSFGLTVGIAFGALAAFGAWRGRSVAPATFAVIGGALVILALVAPSRLRAVHRGWMAVALAMSRVTTPLLMGVVYFGIVTPLGVAMRLVRRRPARRRGEAATFWVDRPAGERRSDLRRQF